MNRFFTVIAVGLGLVAGLLSIYLIPPEAELVLWLLLVALLGGLIQRYLKEKLFLRGFLYGALAGIFVTLVHVLLITDYLDSHSKKASAMETYGFEHAWLTLLVFAPVFWSMLGLLTALSAITWRKLRAD